MKDYIAWECKVGIKGNVEIPGGADWPMRQAIRKAFRDILGVDAEFCFSGWNAELDDIEWDLVRDTSGMINRALEVANKENK